MKAVLKHQEMLKSHLLRCGGSIGVGEVLPHFLKCWELPNASRKIEIYNSGISPKRPLPMMGICCPLEKSRKMGTVDHY